MRAEAITIEDVKATSAQPGEIGPLYFLYVRIANTTIEQVKLYDTDAKTPLTLAARLAAFLGQDAHPQYDLWQAGRSKAG